MLLTLTCFSAAAKTDIPAPTKNFFVNDFAGVIDADHERAMQIAGETLYATSKAQVVVVTIPSLDGQDIESYSMDLASEWGIGDEEEDNGLLLLLSVAEPRVRIEVGSGLEGALPDSKAGRILDTYMIPYYHEGGFSQGLVDTYNALVNEVYVEYGVTPEGYIPLGQEEEHDVSPFGWIVRLAVIVGLIILCIRYPRLFWFILHLFSRGGGHSGGGRSGGGFSGGGGGFSGGGASR